MDSISTAWIGTVAISADDKAFFIQLSARMVELRKAQGITQVQIAEAWGSLSKR